jgi:AcrR family transcriptional regulator
LIAVKSDLPAENPLLPDELAQLPHGRHGLPAEFVDRNQRRRLIAAFTALVGEVGYSGATITALTEAAAVSTRTFYKFFETVEDCCLAAFDQMIDELRPLIAEAWDGQEEWPLRVRATLGALLADFAERPDQARLLSAEPFVAGPRIAARHKAAVEQMVPYLREGRRFRKEAAALPETTERALLGSVDSVVARKVLAGDAESLPGLHAALTQFVLTPFLGQARAHKLATSS